MTYNVVVSSFVGIRIQLKQLIYCLTEENRKQIMELLDDLPTFIEDENETLNEPFHDFMYKMRNKKKQNIEIFKRSFEEYSASLLNEYVCIPFHDLAALDRCGHRRTGINGVCEDYDPSVLPSIREINDHFYALNLSEFKVVYLLRLHEG
jgi:hypothetical protein